MTANRRRNIVYGNDLYREITSPNARQPLQATYWDLWIVLILARQFDGDWEAMIDHFRTKRKEHYHRDEVEGLLNHIRLLRQMLDQKGVTAEQILVEADAELLKKQRRKAKTKILEMRFQSREKSPWMIHTPRRQREERAMRGYWSDFPVSPDEYAARLAGQYKPSGWYTEDQSFGLARKLSRFLERHEARASLPQLFALYRAFLTVVVEKMGRVDDSYGVIGDLYGEVFDGYIGLDWRELDMPPALFFQDLIELIIWEDYAFTWKRERALFASLAPGQVQLVESILREQWQELGELELEYQAEEALTLLGTLYIQQQMFDQFVPMAEEMGTRAWERITTMSEMAEQHGRTDLALVVYETSLGPGMHEEFLRKKYEDLKSRLGSARRNQELDLEEDE